MEGATSRFDLEALVEEVRAAIALGRFDNAAAAMLGLRPADAADVLEALDLGERRRLLRAISDPAAADILEEMQNPDAAEVAEGLDHAQLAAILDEMEAEEAADILGDLSAAQVEGTLLAMDDEAEADIRTLLAFADDSAGGRMTLDFLALPGHLPVAEVIVSFRELSKDLRAAYYLYTVDADGRLLGVANLRELLTAEPNATLADITNPDIVFVHALDDQETAGRLMARYDLVALPVLDDRDRLIGVIQHEDLVDVLVEEATEDMFKMVGVGTLHRPGTPVRASVRMRLPWLVFNLGTQFLLVGALVVFQGAIARVAALAVLFPIVTGQGGNVGAQTMTIMVRSIALGELERASAWRVIGKEALIGLIMGVAMGVLAGGVALVIGENVVVASHLAAAALLAMIGNLAAGALAGSIIPLLLDRGGIDPALASSMLITTVTDTLGVILFMGIFLLLA